MEGADHVMQHPPGATPGTLQGFGSADVSSPFYYGSVADGMSRNLTLEQKLKKKYWKTKQTVIQKFGKGQDEFVVAGDADIDTKLEKAYHLRQSCKNLLQVLEKYSTRLRELSSQEMLMGEYLGMFGESEYTNAGEVMQSVGKVQEADAKARMIIVPPLMRMHHEFSTFVVSAIKDLDQSIQTLEKARTEYRAALLWMKDVSGKLQNPDYRDQLVKFREAQAAVKETKARFEKLKVDLGEKIDMVAASRCNLLSRSLPTYQKEVLDFMDKSASEFHRMLVDLRSHHHHQYKVRRVLEEIRDLEQDEVYDNSNPSPTMSSKFGSTLPVGEGRPEQDDEPLLDIGLEDFETQKEEEQKEGERQPARSGLSGGLAALRELQGELIQPSSDREPLAPVTPTSATTEPGPDSVDSLLQFGPTSEGDKQAGLVDVGESGEGEGASDNQLFDEWSTFSQFMSAEKAPSSASEWEKELKQSAPPPLQDPLLDFESLDLGSSTAPISAPPTSQTGEGVPNKSTDGKPSAKATKPRGAQFDDLFALALQSHKGESNKSDSPTPMTSSSSSPGQPVRLDQKAPSEETGNQPPAQSAAMATKPDPLPDTTSELLSLYLDSTPSVPQESPSLESSTDEGLESLDSFYFQQPHPPPSTLHPTPSTLHPTPLTSTSASQFYSPLSISQSPILPPIRPGLTPMSQLSGNGRGSQSGQPLPGRPLPGRPQSGQLQSGQAKGKEESSWMNVFADLDPLNNEKV